MIVIHRINKRPRRGPRQRPSPSAVATPCAPPPPPVRGGQRHTPPASAEPMPERICRRWPAAGCRAGNLLHAPTQESACDAPTVTSTTSLLASVPPDVTLERVQVRRDSGSSPGN